MDESLADEAVAASGRADGDLWKGSTRSHGWEREHDGACSGNYPNDSAGKLLYKRVPAFDCDFSARHVRGALGVDLWTVGGTQDELDSTSLEWVNWRVLALELYSRIAGSRTSKRLPSE